MLGANFINARNSEIDRNRRIRSENREIFKAFVEDQKASGGRVDPEEFNRFARSLGTTPYQAAGLPSEQTREGMARSINAEVAAREVARANAARAAEISRAQAELGVVEGLATRLANTNVDLGSEEGQAQLGQLAKTLGVNDISAYTPLLPVIQTEALNAQVLSTMKTLNELGLNTEASAGVVTNSLPQRVREGVNSALRSGEEQRRTDAEMTRIQGLDISGIYANAGYNAADATRLAEAELGTTLSAAGRAQLESGFAALERGRGVSGVINTVTGLSAIPQGQLAPLANDQAALEGLARRQLATNGITNPTQDQVATVMAALTPLAQSGVYGAATQAADSIRASIQGSPTEVLANIKNITEAEAFVSAQLAGSGFSIDQLPLDVRRGLVSDTQRFALAAQASSERANEAQWNLMLAGVTEGNPVGAEFMESILSDIGAGDVSRFEQMNVFRSNLGLEPYESMQDPAFIEDYRTLDGLMRREIRTRNEARTAVAQQYASDQVKRFDQTYQDTAIRQTIETGFGQDFEGPLAQVAFRMSNLFYFGSRDHYSIMGDVAAYLEDNPGVAQRMEDGDVTAADEVARLLGAAAGLVPNNPSAAMAYEIGQYSASVGGADWELVQPGQRVPTFLNNQATQIMGVIDSKIAAINALPADADPAQITAIMEGVPEATRDVMQELSVAMSEGGLRYVLDYSGTREAPLQLYMSAFNSQIESALSRLEQATPRGQRRGLIDNGDGTVTLKEGNVYGRPAGVYRSEQSLSGGVQAGEAISVAPTAAQTGFNVDPASSPFMQNIQGAWGSMQLDSALNQARVGLAEGDFGPSNTLGARAINFFRPTDKERNAQMEINGAALDYLYTQSARDFLYANPETLEILSKDPAGWVRLARTGSLADPRASAVIAP